MAEKLTKFDRGRVQWSVPTAGTLRGAPIQSLPENSLHDSLNVRLRESIVEPRPGMTEFVPTILTGRPTGGFSVATLATGVFQEDTFQNDAFQIDDNTPLTALIVGTTQHLYVYYQNAWNVVTGTPDLIAQPHQLARFTSILLGTPPVLYVIHVNGVDTPRQWQASQNFIPLSGDTPPLFSDITTISNRLIGIVPPYSVRWYEALSLTSCPAANERILADTPDGVVAIANFGLTSGAVYKQQSIWNITVTGSGESSSYFRLDPKKNVAGPASAAALVNAPGAHYYMTNNGRIGYWDGYQHAWVADGIWPLLKTNLDTLFTNRIHGSYKPNDEEIWFWYPRIGDAGECKGVAIVKLPNPEEGLSRPIAFHGLMAHPISASIDTRLIDNKVMVFTSSTRKGYTLEGTNDAGTDFSGFFQGGLVATPNGIPTRLNTIESFLERGLNYGAITIKPVYSNLLDNPSGLLGPGVTVNLSTRAEPFDLTKHDIRGRFLGVRHEFTTPVTLRWKGTVLHIPTEQQPVK